MSAIAAENAITVQNLLAAFEGESNAHAKYTAFAARADDRRPARRRQPLSRRRPRRADSCRQPRPRLHPGQPSRSEIHPVEVKSTLENLKAALNGEQYEIDTMYPGFLAEATERKNTAAIRTFHGALEAEKTHARLYSEAIALLAAGKKDSWIGEARDFYVCPVCGYTSETEEEHERCPVCNCPWERFEIIR
jgi:rubrerythrin